MSKLYVLIIVLVILDISIIAMYIRLASRLPKDDNNYYDENGNHIYYDRKLIAHLEKTKGSMTRH